MRMCLRSVTDIRYFEFKWHAKLLIERVEREEG
uniref:Uncharacterized protein n=1 Tax=Anguilla anguilla TaxID=7936 RepID=A0A0E9R9P9_ANGAN